MAAAVTWTLEAFERDPGDELVAEWPLSIDSSAVAKIFGVPEEMAAVGGHRVQREHLDDLAPYLREPIDLERFDYFVEATAG